VGTVAGTPSSLTVRGDQMTPQTGETLRTISPGGTTNYWRMFLGGTEYGRLYAPNNTTNKPFYLSSAGLLRFETSDILRMQLNRTSATTINGFTEPPNFGFFGS
jgi:hypothetical protein